MVYIFSRLSQTVWNAPVLTLSFDRRSNRRLCNLGRGADVDEGLLTFMFAATERCFDDISRCWIDKADVVSALCFELGNFLFV